MIYFIRAEGSELIKIGYAKSSQKRLRQHQWSSPLRLSLIAEFEGERSDEQAAHRALSGGFGEWFPRQDAMRLKRAMEAAGLSAIPAFARWKERERMVRARRRRFNERAYRHVVKNIACSALRIFNDEEMKAKTGLTSASWHNVASGRCAPNAMAVLNSITYAPSHLNNLFRVSARRHVVPISTDNEALECEPEIDAAMEALASLKARCIAIRKARAA